MEYPLCIQSVKQKKIGLACLAKKLGFHTEICEFRDERILTKVIFDCIKKLSKSNKTWYGVSPVQLECKANRIFAITCVGKNFVFHTEFFEFRDQRILKIGFFINLRSCPNQTKFRMEYPICIDSVRQKKFAIA